MGFFLYKIITKFIIGFIIALTSIFKLNFANISKTAQNKTICYHKLHLKLFQTNVFSGTIKSIKQEAIYG